MNHKVFIVADAIGVEKKADELVSTTQVGQPFPAYSSPEKWKRKRYCQLTCEVANYSTRLNDFSFSLTLGQPLKQLVAAAMGANCEA